MSEQNDEQRLSEALREQLESVPVPQASARFNARVLRGLARKAPWWAELWPAARLVLSAAACSVLVTVGLTQAVLQAPVPAMRPGGEREPADPTALERMMERARVTAMLPTAAPLWPDAWRERERGKR